MKKNLDALLAALNVFIDDHVAPCRRIGRPPKPTDAELLCLAVAQVLPGFPSARHWIRFAHARLGHLFRYLPQQSAYNTRLNAARPLISQVIEALARQVPTWHDDLRVVDSTPLPRAASRETVKRSDLAGKEFETYNSCDGQMAALNDDPNPVHYYGYATEYVGDRANDNVGYIKVRDALQSGSPTAAANPGRAGRRVDDSGWVEVPAGRPLGVSRAACGSPSFRCAGSRHDGRGVRPSSGRRRWRARCDGAGLPAGRTGAGTALGSTVRSASSAWTPSGTSSRSPSRRCGSPGTAPGCPCDSVFQFRPPSIWLVLSICRADVKRGP
ncbi:hypothetical protein ABZ595_30245 [Streptomyces rubradiris]